MEGAPTPRAKTTEEWEQEIQSEIDDLPPELSKVWEERFAEADASALPSFSEELHAFLAKRHETLMQNVPHVFEGARHLVTDPEKIGETISRIASLEGRGELYVGGGKVGAVYSDPDVPGICHKFIHNLEDYEAWNSLSKEASFLEELENFEVDGVRTPILHSLIDRPEIKVIDMELLEGENIERTIADNKPLPENFDVDIFFTRLEHYMQEVHSRFGIYHRDLHGGNIIIGSDSTPYVIDFGRATRTPIRDWAYEVEDPRSGAKVVLKSDEDHLRDLKTQLRSYVRKQGQKMAA